MKKLVVLLVSVALLGATISTFAYAGPRWGYRGHRSHWGHRRGGSFIGAIIVSDFSSLSLHLRPHHYFGHYPPPHYPPPHYPPPMKESVLPSEFGSWAEYTAFMRGRAEAQRRAREAAIEKAYQEGLSQ